MSFRISLFTLETQCSPSRSKNSYDLPHIPIIGIKVMYENMLYMLEGTIYKYYLFFC